MAGKEIYIGRMLEALETSMDEVVNEMADVSAGISTTTDILKTILDNMGLQKSQTSYSGTDLTDLNPSFSSKWGLVIGEKCTLSNENKILFYVVQNAGVTAYVDSETIVKFTVGQIRQLTSKVTFKWAGTTTNNSISSRWRNPGGLMGGYVFNVYFPATGSANRLETLSSLSGTSGSKTKAYDLINLDGHPDDEEVWFVINNNFDYTSDTISATCELLDDDGNELFTSGQVVITDNVYSITGSGSLIFDFDFTGTAGELSDVKIIADLNENDSVDLLTADGDIYAADVGLTVPLVDFSSLAFKLRFNMSTGSTLSAINVRYY